MGKEAVVQGMIAGARVEGRLQYEAPKLIFRGPERRVWQGDDLRGLRAEAGELVLADGARFALGEKPAARWADAILNPKGRMQKIGVKAGMRTGVRGVEDDDLATELAAAGAVAADRDLDLLFYAADSGAELDALDQVIPQLAPAGALWIVSKKGKAATLKDVEVMAAAKARGLVDNKVVAFSDTHTALRFVRRKGA